MDLNEVNLLGRAVRDTELKQTPTGKFVATNSIATGKKFTNDKGEKIEDTQFTDVVFWGKSAEIAGEYLSKGKRVFIKGELKTRNWEADDGTKRYKTEVIVKEMILLDGGEKKETSGAVKKTSPQKNEEEISIEDIPF